MTTSSNPRRCATLALLPLLPALLCLARAEVQPQVTLATLRQRITALISQDRFAFSTWGIRIESLDSGATLFATNDHHLLQPASTAKLFSGAFALDELGPDFRIRTSLLSTEQPTRQGVLPGNLLIVGRGDFSFAARFHDGDYARSLDPLVAAVRAAGIRRIQGDLVADARWFRGPPWGTGWTWDDLGHYYGAEVSALNIEDNTVDLVIQPGRRAGERCRAVPNPDTDYLRFVNRTTTTLAGGTRQIRIYRAPGSREVFLDGELPAGSSNWVDAVSVPRPALWFAHLLRDRLRREGIHVRGAPRALEWPEADTPTDNSRTALIEISFAESPPMRTLLAKTLKPSQNQYAQLLLLQAGIHASSASNKPGEVPTSEDIALASCRQFVARMGVSLAEVRLDEGSGLSRTARVTAAAEVQLLRSMAQHRHAAVFREALPIAGVDGTLARRMKGSPAAGRLRAKTGTLAGIHSLAGYVETTAGEQLAFSILVNQHPDSNHAKARADLDELGVLLASLAERSSNSEHR